MANEHMKRCSTSLIIREMPIKTIRRYHLAPVRLAIIKGQKNNSVGEGMKKREPSYTVGGNVKWYSHHGYSMKAPQKIKIRTTTQSINTSLGIHPKNKTKKTTNSKSYMHTQFTVAVFTTAKIQKQSNYPSIDE